MFGLMMGSNEPGYVCRLEITINDSVSLDGEILPSFGFHPHFHALLFVPKDKFGTVSGMELQLKNRRVVQERIRRGY